MTDSAS